jgi:hypothetical protein
MAPSSGGNGNAADQSMRTKPIVDANYGAIAPFSICFALSIGVHLFKPCEETDLDAAIGNPADKVLHLDDYMWNCV